MLTPRQREILALVARGATTERIASELFVSENTVRTHVRHILDSLGAHNRPHAVAIAFMTGLIEGPPRGRSMGAPSRRPE